MTEELEREIVQELYDLLEDLLANSPTSEVVEKHSAHILTLFAEAGWKSPKELEGWVQLDPDQGLEMELRLLNPAAIQALPTSMSEEEKLLAMLKTQAILTLQQIKEAGWVQLDPDQRFVVDQSALGWVQYLNADLVRLAEELDRQGWQKVVKP